MTMGRLREASLGTKPGADAEFGPTWPLTAQECLVFERLRPPLIARLPPFMSLVIINDISIWQQQAPLKRRSQQAIYQTLNWIIS